MTTINLKDLVPALKNEVDTIQKSVVELSAIVQVGNIKNRVERGIGLEDKVMAEYSKGYKSKRKKSGRQAKLRDLMWSGRTIGSIHAETEGDNIAVVTFSDARSAEIARYNHERTPFFGVSPNDMREIEKIVLGEIGKK